MKGINISITTILAMIVGILVLVVITGILTGDLGSVEEFATSVDITAGGLD